MADRENRVKVFRMLSISELLKEGKTVKKSDLAQAYQVTEKSIQRDLEDLRCFLPSKPHPVKSSTMPRREATGSMRWAVGRCPTVRSWLRVRSSWKVGP